MTSSVAQLKSDHRELIESIVQAELVDSGTGTSYNKLERNKDFIDRREGRKQQWSGLLSEL